jgi:hypothetical protein
VHPNTPHGFSSHNVVAKLLECRSHLTPPSLGANGCFPGINASTKRDSRQLRVVFQCVHRVRLQTPSPDVTLHGSKISFALSRSSWKALFALLSE